MTFRMIVQLWNTSVFVSCDADLTENYMYISIITDSVVSWKIQKFDWLIPETM